MNTGMRFRTLLIGLSLALVALLGLLRLEPARAAAPPAAPLTWDALANAEYMVQFGEQPQKVKLTNGEYNEKTGEGVSDAIILRMAQIYALGDLNGDGEADAAVVLGYNTGGSGVFYDLAALVNHDGKPVYAASAALGDRPVLRTVLVRAGRIELEMLAAGPTDPACCPTNHVVLTYTLSGSELNQTGDRQVSESQGQIPFLTWDLLANAEYPTRFTGSGKVRLQDGGYTPSGAADQQPQIRLNDDYATGDLTGSGALDAAVLLVRNPFEDNASYELDAVLNQEGKPVNAGSVSLAEGVQVQGLTIEAGRIVVNLLTPGPRDKPGAPTMKAVQTFRVQSGKLTEVAP